MSRNKKVRFITDEPKKDEIKEVLIYTEVNDRDQITLVATGDGEDDPVDIARIMPNGTLTLLPMNKEDAQKLGLSVSNQDKILMNHIPRGKKAKPKM